MDEREYDEKRMKQAGELLADARLEEFDRMNGEAHRYSSRFRRRAEKLFRTEPRIKAGGRISGKQALRILAVSAAAVILMTVSVMAASPEKIAEAVPALAEVVPAIRELFTGTSAKVTVEQPSPSRLLIRVEEMENLPVDEGKGEPTWIPDGYAVTSRDEHIDGEMAGPSLYINYTKWNHTGILFYRDYVGNGSGYGAQYRADYQVRNAELETESVQIGPYEGTKTTIVSKWREQDGGGEETEGPSVERTLLVWSAGRYVYRMEALTAEAGFSGESGAAVIPLPYEDLLRMAESMYDPPEENSAAGMDTASEGDLCPGCGKAVFEEVCSHRTVMNRKGDQELTGAVPWEITWEGGVKDYIMRPATFCYTDHVCPECGYTETGEGTDYHTEWVGNEADGKEYVCPFRKGGEPAYLPEGYALSKDIQDQNFRLMNYTYGGADREKRHFDIHFERKTIESEDFTAGMKYPEVDLKVEREPVWIGRNQGILIHIYVHDKADAEVKTELSRLIWSDLRYLYELEATTAVSGKNGCEALPYAELLRMAESVSRDTAAAGEGN